MNVIEQIYRLRHDFIVIGLTGRTGSGCSTVAKVLSKDDFAKLRDEYKEFRDGAIDNDVRKNRIVHNYMKEHWCPFTIIKASDVIFYYALLLDSYDRFKENLFLTFPTDSTKVNKPNDDIIANIKNNLDGLKSDFETLHNLVVSCEDYLNKKEYRNSTGEVEQFGDLILKRIPEFRSKLEDHLEHSFRKRLGKDLQRWGNNIRKFNTIAHGKEIHKKSPSCLASKINQFIKMFRAKDKELDRPTLVVIDALRNPYEILYFRERYSAFYTMSVNTEESIRKNNLALLGYRYDEIAEIDTEEKGKKELSLSYERIDIDK